MRNESTTPPSAGNNSNPSLQRTVFQDLHKEMQGKMVEFAGWSMPVQYADGIMAEHKHCRHRASWFDVSHMGQIEIRGPDAARQLESLVPADLTGLQTGHCRYTFFTNEQGGILDDLIVTNAGDHLYLVVNASMRDQDITHLRQHLGSANLTEVKDHALVAVQGPAAVGILTALCPAAADLRFMQSCLVDIDGATCRLSRLGYTGEDGFELSIPNTHAVDISHHILSHEDCLPAGLGARDSLRLEAGLCLYGNDIDTSTTPVEASLAWAIPKRRRHEGGFPGATLISDQITSGTSRRLVGILPDGRVPARHGAPICDASGSPIGKVSSGGFGPTVGAPVVMGYVNSENSAQGTELYLSVRGKLHSARVDTLPFVPHQYQR
ncbi:MAG: glycine cleavage system aminomethyltransferase GcvT [Granulosicoccus sp.]